MGGFKKVAVTGASGMVGRHIIEVLKEEGISCIASSRSKPPVLPPQSSWKGWDLMEFKTPRELDDFFPGVAAIFHLGAYIPPKIEDNRDLQYIFDVNVRSCLGLAQWALVRNLPLLFLSSATVYKALEKRNIREDDPKTTGGLGGFYGYSKLLAEESLQYFFNKGLRLCILRPSSVYGYGLAQGKMINNFLELIALNKSIRLNPPVDDKINLIHALDVANAMIQALNSESWGVFNIAGKEAYSILEIAETCLKVLGKGNIEISQSMNYTKPSYRFDLNSDKAERIFGFKPNLTLSDGLKKMCYDKLILNKYKEQ